jgi:mono/diheme cytochrome c family protein
MRLAAVVLLCAFAIGEAQAQEFSRAQAARGREQFSAHCATCHSEKQAAS